MFRRIAESPSKSLLVMTGAFVAGVAAHATDERAWAPVAWAFAVGAVLLALAAMTRRLPVTRLAFVAVALVAFGIARYEAVLPGPDIAVALPHGTTAFTGTVAEEPYESLQGTVLVMDRVFFSDAGRERPLGAGMELRYRVPLRAGIGDALSWRCKPRARDAASRDRRGRDVAWTCLPEDPPEPASAGIGHPFLNALVAVKRKIRDTAAVILPEPDASLLMGLLIGDTGGIPKDVIAAFRATGTSHVLAVSGYNVHLVVECAFMLLAACAVRRRQASYAVAALLAAFTVMTGAEAPVVRAAVMGGLGLIAGLLGRRGGGAAPLALAAAVMLAHDPLILRHDVGFRLSFAAVLGMRAFGPAFTRVFAFVPEAAELRKTCAETLAATIATTPIALHDFGLLPLAGPVANLAVVPLVPLMTAVGAAGIAAGAVLPALAWPFMLPCAAFSRAMIGAVTAIAAVAPALPLRASAWAETALYGWLGLLWFGVTRPPRPPRRPVVRSDAVAVTYDA